jgi:hypothetical protein
MDYATQQFNRGSRTLSDSDVYVRGMGSQKKYVCVIERSNA